MSLRTWLSAALVVGLVSISGRSLADSRMNAQRYQPPARMEQAHAGVAQARNARAQRAQPASTPPARAKQARLEPKPPSDAARQSSQAAGRTGRGRH